MFLQHTEQPFLRKEDEHPCRNPLGLVGSLCVLMGAILRRRNIAGFSQVFDQQVTTVAGGSGFGTIRTGWRCRERTKSKRQTNSARRSASASFAASAALSWRIA